MVGCDEIGCGDPVLESIDMDCDLVSVEEMLIAIRSLCNLAEQADSRNNRDAAIAEIKQIAAYAATCI